MKKRHEDSFFSLFLFLSPIPFSYKKSPLFLIAEDGPSIEPLPLTETEDSREG